MIKNQILKIFYCHKCGWSITNKVLESIIGTNDLINYCEECGGKLNVSNININDDKSYLIKEFFYDIKKEISQIEGKTLNFFQISLQYFNKYNKWYINDRIRRSKSDPDWILTSGMLNSYENTLRSNLGTKFKKLERFFVKYRIINLTEHKQREYTEQTKSYFKKINTKEKMYWFCWILAEGGFTKNFLEISISPKDGILLKWFIEDLGINCRWVRFEHSFDKRSEKYYKHYILGIYNKDFVDNLREGAIELYTKDLIWNDFLIGEKSSKIRFPRFATKDVLMAGLLGFFDGDGTHSGETPRIGSICKEFLWDIVEIFELPTYKEPKPHYTNGKIVKYNLNIGAELFMDLLNNYERSLERKRINYWRFCNKFLLTRDQLQTLVNENPGISGQGIADKHLDLTGVKIGRRTALEKMKKWNIKKTSKEDYLWLRIIELLRKDWSLKKIWVKELGYSLKSWDKNRWRFFKRIFKNDPLVESGNGNIVKRIEEIYRPSD